jgi:hypothetical protein
VYETGNHALIGDIRFDVALFAFTVSDDLMNMRTTGGTMVLMTPLEEIETIIGSLLPTYDTISVAIPIVLDGIGNILETLSLELLEFEWIHRLVLNLMMGDDNGVILGKDLIVPLNIPIHEGILNDFIPFLMVHIGSKEVIGPFLEQDFRLLDTSFVGDEGTDFIHNGVRDLDNRNDILLHGIGLLKGYGRIIQGFEGCQQELSQNLFNPLQELDRVIDILLQVLNGIVKKLIEGNPSFKNIHVVSGGQTIRNRPETVLVIIGKPIFGQVHLIHKGQGEVIHAGDGLLETGHFRFLLKGYWHKIRLQFPTLPDIPRYQHQSPHRHGQGPNSQGHGRRHSSYRQGH